MSSFSDFSLDARLVQALTDLTLRTPLPVQSSVIPVALTGKDIFIQAKCGSGKTLAYTLPLLQIHLQNSVHAPKSSPTSLILVPSRELALQVHSVVSECVKYIPDVRTRTLVSGVTYTQSMLNETDVLICTPSRLAELSAEKRVDLSSIEFVVLDEGDLLLSFGYEDDIRTIFEELCEIRQVISVSATLGNSDVEKKFGKYMKEAEYCVIEEEEDVFSGNTEHYYVKTTENDRFLVAYGLLKLKIINGKILIFVSDVKVCYRLKLFLERFSIKSAVLNRELPSNTRIRIIEQFNKGVFDILIATEQLSTPQTSSKQVNQLLSEQSDNVAIDFGVSRGVDFKNVDIILNFDIPKTVENYTHQAGRTGRGVGNDGNVLTLVSTNRPEDLERLNALQSEFSDEMKQLPLNLNVINVFRYRVEDMLRSVTGYQVQEARVKEIKMEMFNSEKLRAHFEDNPKDLELLKHDKVLRPRAVQKHLKFVPTYIANKVMGEGEFTVEEGEQVKTGEYLTGKQRNYLKKKGLKRNQKKWNRRRIDPLKKRKK